MLTVGLDRVFDVLFLLLIGSGAIVAFARLAFESALVPVLITSTAALTALWCVTSRRGRRAAGAVVRKVLPERLSRPLLPALGSLVDRAKQVHPARLVAAGVLTALAWMTNYLSVYLFSVALGFHVPFLDICGITAVSSLVTFLPISVLGLGTRDATLIALLDPYGVSTTGAVARSTMYLSMTFWSVLVCCYPLAIPVARLSWPDALRQTADFVSKDHASDP